MAKKKLIPTWLKLAAVAALFVPYKVKVERDEDNRLKRLSAKSLALKLTYTPAEGDGESDITLNVPGFSAPDCDCDCDRDCGCDDDCDCGEELFEIVDECEDYLFDSEEEL